MPETEAMTDLPTPLDLLIVTDQLKARVIMGEIGKHYVCTASHDPSTTDTLHVLMADTQHCKLCLDQWPCQQTIDYAAWRHLRTLSDAMTKRFLTNTGLGRLVLDG